MRGKSCIVFWPVLLVALSMALAGCGQPVMKDLNAQPNRKEVSVEASSFKFEPSVIQARKGDTLVFKILNSSSMTHNFTIKDPRNSLIKSVDLPEKQTVTVEVELREPGTYEFHCDKMLHSTMGMKGRVEAIP